MGSLSLLHPPPNRPSNKTSLSLVFFYKLTRGVHMLSSNPTLPLFFDTYRDAPGQKNKKEMTECAAAARAGNLALLQILRAQWRPCDEDTCASAGRGGHLVVLQWAREYGDIPWNEYTCTFAAAGGHLEVLQWARERTGVIRGIRMRVVLLPAKDTWKFYVGFMKTEGCFSTPVTPVFTRIAGISGRNTLYPTGPSREEGGSLSPWSLHPNRPSKKRRASHKIFVSIVVSIPLLSSFCLFYALLA